MSMFHAFYGKLALEGTSIVLG